VLFFLGRIDFFDISHFDLYAGITISYKRVHFLYFLLFKMFKNRILNVYFFLYSIINV